MRTTRRLPALPTLATLLIAIGLLVAGCDVFSTTTTPIPSLPPLGPTLGAPIAAPTAGAPTAAASSSPLSSGAGPSASASAAASGNVGASASAPASPPATATATIPATPRPSPVTCTPEEPTALSAQWTTLEANDGDFTFKYPANWEHLYGASVFEVRTLLDERTVAETGLAPTTKIKADLVRAPNDGLPNASVLIVPGVSSPAREVYLRQEDLFRAIPKAEIRRTDLQRCLDGLLAYGIELTFGDQKTLQRSFYVVHNGRSYDFQWLNADAANIDVFEEMFRTWSWTPNFPAATPVPAPERSAFVEAGMAAMITPGAPRADPSTFRTTLSKDLISIYAVFTLRPGLTGRVEGELLREGAVLVTLALDYQAKHTWGDFRINSASGFTPGSYQMKIRYVPTGEEITLPFTIA